MARLKVRDQVRTEDTWDLSKLFASEHGWARALRKLEKMAAKYAQFRGKLANSMDALAECLEFDSDVDRLFERVGAYAFLKAAEDQTNADSQRMLARFRNVATRCGEASSFLRPEILSLSKTRIAKLLSSSRLKKFRISLERLVRFKPYTLSAREEELLAMQGEMAAASGQTFRQLLDADMTFGTVRDADGRSIELTHATLSQLLYSPRRSVRKTAFHQYYEQIRGHENTLASTLAGSVHKDVYYARARGYASALASALFPDQVDERVYDNLIRTVRRSLPAVHHYYDVRRRKMKLKQLHHYDTYVPILPDLTVRRTWKQAAETVMAALRPLGAAYGEPLQHGLMGRWCDRYPNRGKQSGAFSYGTYDSDPYIMMNYKPDVPDDVFTLAHEAGHSMHTYFSARHQPFEYYNYTIFVAEVASTFNEELLNHYLLAHAGSDRERAFLLNRHIDAMRGTIIRQTMFAEFEKTIHAMAEAGEPLTLQTFQDVYGRLLRDYFGPQFVIDEQLTLEGLRIPHFYRAFYVYKYATGMSAAIALAHRVLQGGPQALEDYLGFLQAGCSKYPLDILRDAGVDMQQPKPIRVALQQFEQLVNELDELL